MRGVDLGVESVDTAVQAPEGGADRCELGGERQGCRKVREELGVRLGDLKFSWGIDICKWKLTSLKPLTSWRS